MSAGLHLHRPQNPVEIISRSSFLPIPEETAFTQFFNNPERFRSPATSNFEKRPTRP